MVKVSIVIPTIKGREEYLERCMDAYYKTNADLELIIEHDHRTCGLAWNAGAEKATGDYLHLTADDLVPHEGWFEAAVDIVEGTWSDPNCYPGIPAPQVLLNDIRTGYHMGQIMPFSAIPFCSMKQWRRIGPCIPVHLYCVPTDHRILTQRGWRFYDELTVGEPVMSFHPDTHEMKWEPLLEVSTFPYSGELSVIERKGDRFEFTPNHRWPFMRYMPRRQAWWTGIAPANELRANDCLPIRGNFQESKSVLTPKYAAILGWLISDGYYCRRASGATDMRIMQSERKYLAQVERLVGRKAVPSRGGTYNDVGTVYVIPEDKRVIERVYEGKQSLKELVPKLSRAAAQAMLDAIFMAEGSYTKAGGKVIAQDAIANPEVREAIQVLALMTGSNASLHSKDIFLKTSKSLSLGFQNRRKQSMPYRGTVWCPSTATGTWIMEHNGGAIPTGNTDNYLSWRAAQYNWYSLYHPGYCFDHWHAMHGRGAGMEESVRFEHDRRYYEEAIKNPQRG